jgi:hypothetical protein
VSETTQATDGVEGPVKHVGKVISILADSPDPDLDRRMLAARLGISPDYLGKLF